jgi:hypothetical protein
MTTVLIAGAAGIFAFCAGLLGLFAQRRLPKHHMSAGSRDMVGSVLGLLSLLLALALGTLVGSANSFFAAEDAAVQSLCSRSLELDLAFRQYGPAVEPLRSMLKASMVEALAAIQGNRGAYQRHFDLTGYMGNFERWNEMLSSLEPANATEARLVDAIAAASQAFQETRLQMSLQLESSAPWPLIAVVLLWALLLFFGFGIVSGLNATSLGALAFGAFAVSSAIFLIVELDQPLSGLLHVPIAPIEQTVLALSPGGAGP